jgi:carboxypeptidase family protein
MPLAHLSPRPLVSPIARSARALAAASVLLAACSTATQRVYVAPTAENIVSTTEVRQGDPPVHLVFVENHSTVPVTVFSVSLSGCENVKQQCSPRPASIRLAPGARQIAIRVEPENRDRAFGYRFGFGWRADSASTGALSALAAAGDERAKARLTARQRADSIARTEWGARYKELTRDDFAALAGRVAMLRVQPESLVLAPGERTNLERIQLLVADSQGVAFGRTGWVNWQVPSTNAVQFFPPGDIVARAPGRMVIRFRLAEEAQAILQRPIREVEYPVVVAYPPDPHAPVFAGLAVDADSKTPLACVRVALEDSAQNVVSSARTGKTGTFVLNAPRPGTYRVRVDAFGWAPVYGPPETATADETKQSQYGVRFVDQLLTPRRGMAYEDFQHAYPAAVSTAPISTSRGAATPIVRAVTLGGSESMPILGIIGSAPAGTTWMQFVVDSTGGVDTTSVLLPPGTSKAAAASVRSMLPRVRFSPARDAGRPTCELLRMQVNFSPR